MILSLLNGAGKVLDRLMAWLRTVITLWRLMTLAAVVFAAGISGTWFNKQFADDLGGLHWGWFGAVLVGLCLFAGVTTAIKGMFRKQLFLILLGLGLIGIGAVVDATMGAQYFGQQHEGITQIVLSLFAPLIAILSGAAEAVNEWMDKQEHRQVEAQTRQEDLQKEIAIATATAKARAAADARIEIERVKAEERVRLRELEVRKVHEISDGSAEVSRNSADRRETSVKITLTAHEQQILEAARARLGLEFSSSEAVGASPFGQTKTYELLERAKGAGVLEKSGHGKWRWTA